MWEIPGISLHCNNLPLNVFNSIKKMYFIDCRQLIETMMNIVGIDGQIFKVYLNVLSKIRVLTIFSINHKPQPTKTTVRSENCGLVCCCCCCDERREMWVCCVLWGTNRMDEREGGPGHTETKNIVISHKVRRPDIPTALYYCQAAQPYQLHLPSLSVNNQHLKNWKHSANRTQLESSLYKM